MYVIRNAKVVAIVQNKVGELWTVYTEGGHELHVYDAEEAEAIAQFIETANDDDLRFFNRGGGQ